MNMRMAAGELFCVRALGVAGLRVTSNRDLRSVHASMHRAWRCLLLAGLSVARASDARPAVPSPLARGGPSLGAKPHLQQEQQQQQLGAPEQGAPEQGAQATKDYELGTSGYELQDASFAYEFSPKANRAFNASAASMRAVALGFLVHAVVETINVLTTACLTSNAAALLELGGCIDELAYAYLINEASFYFVSVAQTSGRDIENLMDGFRETNKFWIRMRKPLVVKSALMLLQIVWRLISHARYNDATLHAVLAPFLSSLYAQTRTALWAGRTRTSGVDTRSSAARAARLIRKSSTASAPGVAGYERYLREGYGSPGLDAVRA